MLYLNLFRRAGHGLSFLMHPCGARTPSFFFVREKERWGRKKKPYKTIRRGETHSLPRGNPCVAAGFAPLQEK